MSIQEDKDNGGGVEMDKTIKTLSNTLTTLYESDLKELNSKFDDFKDRQDQLNKEMQTEKAFYKDNKELQVTVELMTKIQTYKDKLIAIKKEMGNIHNRAKNLKRKANEIKDYKLKQLNHP